MGGVGSFNRLVRTLYVGYGGDQAGLSADGARHLLTDTFLEWGPLEHVYVVPGKNIAFVRYKHRAYAEFAKYANSLRPNMRQFVANFHSTSSNKSHAHLRQAFLALTFLSS